MSTVSSDLVAPSAAIDTDTDTDLVKTAADPSPRVATCRIPASESGAAQRQVLSTADCPCRLLLDQIADKWSILILAALCSGPHRFNELKRRLEGVTQKALTQTLRRLERNGIVARHVLATSPVAVEYEITALGKSLKAPFEALYRWTIDYLPQVDAARETFDARRAALDNTKTGAQERDAMN